MQQPEMTFDVPAEIALKLLTGEYEKIGSVIKEQATNEIIALLRETDLIPSSPKELFNVPFLYGANLSIVPSIIPSVLNLGATVAFGFGVISNKLDRIEKKLDRIDAKLDVINEKIDEINSRIQRLQWTVDFGFARTLQALDDIKLYQEIQLAGELNSAASMAWSCQFLEPNSSQRLTRIENAFGIISTVKEKLLLHAENEINSEIQYIQDYRWKKYDFNFHDSVITALNRFRQTIIACSLSASICAESGDTYSAGNKLLKEYEKLSNLFYELVSSSFNSDEKVYKTLLNPAYQDVMPASRLDNLSKLFDENVVGLEAIVELLRNDLFHHQDEIGSEDTKTRTTSSNAFDFLFALDTNQSNPIVKKQQSTTSYVSQSAIESAELFFDLVEGIYEDLERLHGYALEYKLMSKSNLTIHEYRDLLSIQEMSENKKLAFFKLP